MRGLALTLAAMSLGACVGGNPLLEDYTASQHAYIADAHAIQRANSNYVRLASSARSAGLPVSGVTSMPDIMTAARDSSVATGYLTHGGIVWGLPLATDRAAVEADNAALRGRMAAAGIDVAAIQLFDGD